jgi:hypothetical protein
MLLAGCGSTAENSEDKAQLAASIETPTEQTTASGEKDSFAGFAEDNYIDYNEVCANITIEGTKYAMPFTFNDISDKFSCEDAKNASTEGYCVASLVLDSDNNKRLTVEIKDEEQNHKDLSNKPITSIMYSAYVLDLEGNYYFDDKLEQAPQLDFNGVTLGMSLEEVQDAWGIADTYQSKDEKGTAYNYMTADQKITVQVMVDSEDKVYSITLVNHRL